MPKESKPRGKCGECGWYANHKCYFGLFSRHVTPLDEACKDYWDKLGRGRPREMREFS